VSGVGVGVGRRCRNHFIARPYCHRRDKPDRHWPETGFRVGRRETEFRLTFPAGTPRLTPILSRLKSPAVNRFQTRDRTALAKRIAPAPFLDLIPSNTIDTNRISQASTTKIESGLNRFSRHVKTRHGAATWQIERRRRLRIREFPDYFSCDRDGPHPREIGIANPMHAQSPRTRITGRRFYETKASTTAQQLPKNQRDGNRHRETVRNAQATEPRSSKNLFF